MATNIIKQVKGTSNFSTDHTGLLVSLVDVPGTYKITIDGKTVERPSSYLATFDDGTMVNWPAWVDDDEVKHPWSLFDPNIQLTKHRIHCYRDANKRFHLELA